MMFVSGFYAGTEPGPRPGRRVSGRIVGIGAARQALDLCVPVGLVEERHRLTPLGRCHLDVWIHHPMQRGAPPVVRPHLHEVAQVDDKTLFHMRYTEPLTRGGQQLQASGGLARFENRDLP